MRKRPLGKSGLALTVMGLGAAAMGGRKWCYAWPEADDRKSARTIRAAVDLGINWVDTAHLYGNGHSEEVVGRALKGIRHKENGFSRVTESDEGGLGEGCGAVVEGGVGQIHPVDFGHYALEFKNRLQGSLARFRLVGRVGRHELASAGQGGYRRGYEMIVETGPQEV